MRGVGVLSAAPVVWEAGRPARWTKRESFLAEYGAHRLSVQNGRSDVDESDGTLQSRTQSTSSVRD